MGFRCPECLKDFGIDKKAFIEHIQKCGEGSAKEIVNAYTSSSKEEAEQHLANYKKIKIAKENRKWKKK